VNDPLAWAGECWLTRMWSQP